MNKSWILLSILVGRVASQERLCVLIDAGSTGSRVHVYHIRTTTSADLPTVRQQGKALKNYAALAAFSAHPHLAGPSLLPLIGYASEQVSDLRKKETNIYLMATAGLRMLEISISEAILESCRQVLAASGFAFEAGWAAVLPGSTEGIYSFVAANYAAGTLQQLVAAGGGHQPPPAPEELVGVLELGGASLQVTFHADGSDVGPQTRRVSLGGARLDVFTHSFLGFGQDAAQQTALRLAASRLPEVVPGPSGEAEAVGVAAPTVGPRRVLDPCLPRGYDGELDGVLVSGGGYFGLCRQITAGIVLGNCTALRCALGGLYLPPLTGRFLGIENLQYTAGFLGIPHASTVRQLLDAAQAACSLTWPDMLQRFPQFESEHLLRYCFGAAYAVALLHDGLGFGLDDSSLLFTDSISSPIGGPVVLDWTLGAVVLAANANGPLLALDRVFPLTPEARRAAAVASLAHQPGASTPEVLLIAAGLILAAAFCVSIGRRPRRDWKRKRRRARPAQPAPGAARSDAADADEESTDSEGPLSFGVAGPHAVGRRQNVARSGDLEQGVFPG